MKKLSKRFADGDHWWQKRGDLRYRLPAARRILGSRAMTAQTSLSALSAMQQHLGDVRRQPGKIQDNGVQLVRYV